MSKIALGMIVKGTGEEPKKLDRALSSVQGKVDALYITLTGPRDEILEAEKVCKKFGAIVSYTDARLVADEKMVSWLKGFFKDEPFTKVGDTIFQFDIARNYNLSQIPKEYDWLFWMDCDDVVLGGENLRILADEGMKSGVEAYYLNYLYQVEMDGDNIKHVLIQHLRERLVRNNDAFKWIAPIHETLIEQRGTQKSENKSCEVLHLSSIEDRKASLFRNLKSLELAIYRTEGKDPRHNYYLAKALFDLATPEYDKKVMSLIMDHYLFGEHPSGWQEERAQAWEYIAEVYRRNKEHNNSIKSLMNALIETPENASIFVNLASSYMLKSEWDRAIFWIKMSLSVPHKQTTLVVNPKDIQARTLEVLYNACLNLSKVDEAHAAAVKLVNLFPQDDSVLKGYQFIEMLRQQRDLTKEYTHLADYLTKTGEGVKVKALLASLPQTIKDNPFMVNLFKKNNPPTVWGDKSIVIYCGPGFTPWSPKQMKNPQGTFVGGSEEAVILMAEALKEKGWGVTVFADPGQDEGEINGVQWLPYYKYNGEDHFNILIGWRDVRFFDGNYDAKKRYLWCHDILNNLDFTKERVDKITKIIVLSKFHRDCISTIEDGKILLSSNGIPEDL